MPIADFITELIMGFIDDYLFDEDHEHEEEDDNDGEKKAPDSTTPGD